MNGVLDEPVGRVCHCACHRACGKASSSAPQSTGPESATSESLGTLLEMQILRFHPKLIQQETPGVEA